MADYKNVPILYIDVEAFQPRDLPTKRVLLARLQDIATTAARFFMPFGEVWKKWRRHGTGDGYYFLFDALPPHVAYLYARRFDQELARHNAAVTDQHLRIRLRMVLVQGDVEQVDDQYLSDAFTEAARFSDHPPFKALLKDGRDHTVLACSALFHELWRTDASRDDPALPAFPATWTRFALADKHGAFHAGYVLGDGLPAAATAPPAPTPLRIAVLIGHSVRDPLPEAVELAAGLVHRLRDSHLLAEIRVDQASVANLKREVQLGCDLLVYIGHGGEDGRLQFADGPRGFDDTGGAALWDRVPACFIFACHGERFTAALNRPWLAFTGLVSTEAPLGFLNAWVDGLAARDLASAVSAARESCGAAMADDLMNRLVLSAVPLPALPVAAGRPNLARLSPNLAGTCDLDDGSRVRYPLDDPFVGRVAVLEHLLALPADIGDSPRQRVLWVTGDAGIGKSTLLKRFALAVRDLGFHEPDQPLYLFHMVCWQHTSASQLERELLGRLAALYPLPAPPATPQALVNALAERPGRHVWVLDDLTYLAGKPHRNEEAARLVESLRAAAKSAALPWQMVVSSRRPEDGTWDQVPLETLREDEVTDLARAVLPTGIDIGAARALFHQVGGSTALYKRALLLAKAGNRPLAEYAEELRSAVSLAGLDLMDQARAMAAFEIERLDGLSSQYHFRFGPFVARCFALFKRVGWFTEAELRDWFGDAFRPGGAAANCRPGLEMLERLGYLIRQRKDGGDVLVMPPNQREILRAMADDAAALPANLPWRGAMFRLSLAVERFERGDWSAVHDVEEVYRDYAAHTSEPEVAFAVLRAIRSHGEIVHMAEDWEGAQGLWGLVAETFDRLPSRLAHGGDPSLLEEVAMALFNKGITLGQLERPDHAIAACDDLVARCGDRTEPGIVEQVAKALVYKGITLGRLERPDDAIAAYDDLVARCGDRTEPGIVEQVAIALVRKAFTQATTDRMNDAAQTLDDLEDRYGDKLPAQMAEAVSKLRALFAATPTP